MKHIPVPKGLQVVNVLHSGDRWVPERARCADVAPPFSTLTQPLPRGIKLQPLIKGLYTPVYRSVVTGWVVGGGGEWGMCACSPLMQLVFYLSRIYFDSTTLLPSPTSPARRFAAPLLYNAANDYREEPLGWMWRIITVKICNT